MLLWDFLNRLFGEKLIHRQCHHFYTDKTVDETSEPNKEENLEKDSDEEINIDLDGKLD